MNNYYFSTRAGNAESVREFSFLYNKIMDTKTNNLLRGTYCPIVGCDKYLNPSRIFTVKNKIEDNS
jgi:hypothetical protein